METKDREHRIYFVTLMGSVVNVVLLVFKFMAGILGGSAAMIADAVHSLSDFLTDIVVVLFVKISSKPEDKDHDYGHGKYETLATSLWAALFSIVLKEWTYRFTVKVGKEVQSQAVIANAWHHRSDSLSSIGTAIGIGGAIFLGKEWAVLDPIAAVVVSIFIIRTAAMLVSGALDELLEKSLPDAEERQIAEIVQSEPEVSGMHHLCTRRIGSRIAIEMHLRMPGDISLNESHAHATNIERKLRSHFGERTHINIHVEPLK